MLCGFRIKLRYVIFDKFTGWRLWKEDLAKVFFYEFFVVFQNIDIVEHPRTAASKVRKDFWKISLKELEWSSLRL